MTSRPFSPGSYDAETEVIPAYNPPPNQGNNDDVLSWDWTHLEWENVPLEDKSGEWISKPAYQKVVGHLNAATEEHYIDRDAISELSRRYDLLLADKDRMSEELSKATAQARESRSHEVAAAEKTARIMREKDTINKELTSLQKMSFIWKWGLGAVSIVLSIVAMVMFVQLSSMKEEREAGDGVITEQSTHMHSLKSTLDDSRQANADLTSRNQDLQRQITELNSAIESSRKDAEKSRDAERAKSREIEVLRQQLDKAKTQASQSPSTTTATTTVTVQPSSDDSSRRDSGSTSTTSETSRSDQSGDSNNFW